MIPVSLNVHVDIGQNRLILFNHLDVRLTLRAVLHFLVRVREGMVMIMIARV